MKFFLKLLFNSLLTLPMLQAMDEAKSKGNSLVINMLIEQGAKDKSKIKSIKKMSNTELSAGINLAARSLKFDFAQQMAIALLENIKPKQFKDLLCSSMPSIANFLFDAYFYGFEQKSKDIIKSAYDKKAINQLKKYFSRFVDKLDIKAIHQLLVLLIEKIDTDALTQLIVLLKEKGGIKGLFKNASNFDMIEIEQFLETPTVVKFIVLLSQLFAKETGTVIDLCSKLFANVDLAELKKLTSKNIENVTFKTLIPFLEQLRDSTDIYKVSQAYRDIYTAFANDAIPQNVTEYLSIVFKSKKPLTVRKARSQLQWAGLKLSRALEIAREAQNDIAIIAVLQELTERKEQLFKAIDQNDINFVKYALTQLEVTVVDELGNTPLHRAIQNNNHELALLLYKLDTNQETLSIANKKGEKPMDLALQLVQLGKTELFVALFNNI